MKRRYLYFTVSIIAVSTVFLLSNVSSKREESNAEVSQYISKEGSLDNNKQRTWKQSYKDREILIEKEHIIRPSRGKSIVKDNVKPSYNIDNLTEKSNVTKEHLQVKLEGTPLYDVAEDFILAEEKYGINALFLCALSIQESSWGKSRLAQNKNNIFGYGAYNNSPYSSAKGFPSKSECIEIVSERLSKNYLTEGGKYYNGKSLNAVNIRYSLDDKGNPNKEWNKNIRALMKQLSR